MSLRFSIATGDITPPAGLPMGGYAARVDVATGAIDPLRCCAAVVSDASATVALVVLDLVYVRADWSAPLRESIGQRLGCAADNVMVAATHTHAGPAVFHSALVDCERLRAYERDVAGITLKTVERARDCLQSVQLAVGHACQSGVAASRHEATQPIDDHVRVLVARAPSGQPVGVMAAFGCHPTVLAATNLQYSRDLFGAAVNAAEARLGAPVALFNGAAADVSTRFTRRTQHPPEVARLGCALGDAIVQAVSRAVPLPDAPIRARVELHPVTPRPLPTVEVAQGLVAEASARLQEARSRGETPGDTRRREAALEGALAQLFMALRGPQVVLGRRPETGQRDGALVQLLEITGCDVLGVPGELFSSVGGQVCGARTRPTILVGYANDYLGYFVPPPVAASGVYEALLAVVDPSSAATLAERLAGMRIE